MFRLSVVLLSMALLTGCGAAAVAPAPAAVAGQAEARLLETFAAHVVARPANKGYLSLAFTARSLTGKTFTSENPLVLADGKSNANAFGSNILLGADGHLYVQGGYRRRDGESTTDVEGWFKVGSYKGPGNLQPKRVVTYKLTNGSKLKMNWKGLNPMGEDFMIFQFGRNLSPLKSAPALLKK